MSEWTKLVQKTFKLGKAKRATYTLRDAMKEAKKAYKASASTIANVAKSKTRRVRRRRGGKKSA